MSLSNERLNGIIIKSIAGFCYVEVGNKVYECKPRGSFRKEGISPSAGDRVTISLSGQKGTVEEILPRKNFLLRPPLANLDKLFIVSSCTIPAVNPLLIDRMTAICEHIEVEPVIVFNKADLGDFGELPETYKKAGYKTFVVSAETGDGTDAIKTELQGKLSAFCGNSGVGKSSLLNRLLDGVRLSIGEVSEKLGRGKHTTRTVELFRVSDGYVADTPGFSTLELTDFMLNDKDELKFCFPEFSEHFGQCRFNSCTHVNEPDCSVINAVKNGEISKSRHDSYVSMFEDLKKIKSWEINKK
jgi:ribosome biogenesis GTPase